MSHPKRYVEPEVSAARVDRLWANVSSRLERRRSRAWLVVPALLLGAATAAAIYTQLPPRAPIAATGASAKPLALVSETVPATARLSDGSRIALEPHGALSAVEANSGQRVSVRLARGKAHFDVTHRAGRAFLVQAGDVTVRVVGTEFDVKTTSGDAPRVEVSVLRGAVEIVSARRPGIVARVAAGESWLLDAGAASPPPAAQGSGDTQGGSSAPSSVEPSPRPSSSAVVSAAAASELFEKAGELRRAGDASGAVAAYEQLLVSHGKSSLAGLAAFEAGRLRMDRLRDLAGAAALFERSLRLNGAMGVREDALARLVTVYAARGDGAGCARARDRYLESYPRGVHAAAVSSRCGTR
jgi:hypothetical protein